MNMTIFVVGTGMYVIGRGTQGFGTIFPGVFEFVKKNTVHGVNLKIVSRSRSSTESFLSKLNEFNSLVEEKLGIEVTVQQINNNKSLKKIFDEDQSEIRCAIVATPDDTHFDVLKDCGRSGVHALVVKPFVLFPQNAIELINLFETNKLIGLVEFHKRFDHSNMLAKAKYEAGEIGLLNSIIVEYSQRLVIPSKIFKKWVKNTNIFQYLGIHYVDQIQFVTGATPIRLMAKAVFNKLSSLGIDVADEIHVVIEWRLEERVFLSTFRTSWVDSNFSSAMSDQKISYYGSEGHMRLDQKNRGFELQKGCVGLESINPYFNTQIQFSSDKSPRFYGYGIDSIVNFLAKVVKNAKGSDNVDIDVREVCFRDALTGVNVLSAVATSLQKEGGWVVVKGY